MHSQIFALSHNSITALHSYINLSVWKGQLTQPLHALSLRDIINIVDIADIIKIVNITNIDNIGNIVNSFNRLFLRSL